MNRTIREKQVTDEDFLRVISSDEPGPGGANHNYVISHYTESTDGASNTPLCTVKFQYGPIKENGTNGVQNEDLIAIVIDRLRGFQSGDFKCRENAIALTKLEEALMWLEKRTADRQSRGVEGTHQI